MRRSPRKDPPERPEDPVFTCETCGKDYGLEACHKRTEEHADGAVTEHVECPVCAEHLAERLVQDPDGL